LFALDVKVPVRLRVAADLDGAHLEHGFGAP